MKTCRKMMSLLLIAVLVLSLGMSSVAFAATPAQNGSITISNAVESQTYTIYEILYLESYNTTTNSYSYKAKTAWKSFVESPEIKDIYLTTDEQGYVTKAAKDDSDFAEFAKLALAYAEKNNIANQGKKTADNSGVKFENLELGYYLVDTSLGALCSLTTTKPAATITEKNVGPDVEKKIVEGDTLVDQNDVSIGDKVNYKTTIKAKVGAENYVLHDVMDPGLTLDKTSIRVDGKEVTDAIGTVSFETNDSCTFEIAFSQTYLDKVKADTDIVVTYSAVLNDKAVIGLPGNPNKTMLAYGDSNKTTWKEVTTYTYDLKIFKYTNVVNDNGETVVTSLKDAQFVLLDTTKTKVAQFTDGKLSGWSAAIPTEDPDVAANWPVGSVLTSPENGYITVAGLDQGTYYLREILAPAGFNNLKGDTEVKITGVSASGEYATVTVEVENKTGAELPSTGGIGTTIFYALGTLLVVGAGIMLVTKRRMGNH